MIVVLDSGIWISAFQFGGIPQAALDSVFRDHTIAICDQIVWEVRATRDLRRNGVYSFSSGVRSARLPAMPWWGQFSFLLLLLIASVRQDNAWNLQDNATATDIFPTAPASRRSSETAVRLNGLMRLDVTVTNPAGDPIGLLQPGDFTVLDNGRPQKIVAFQSPSDATAVTDSPAGVVVLLDMLNMPPALAAFERQQTITFLRRKDGFLLRPVTLYSLVNRRLTRIAGPSQDGNLLANALTSDKASSRPIDVGGIPQGFVDGAYVYPQINALGAIGVIATAEFHNPGRKLLLWVGSGLNDRGSGAYLDNAPGATGAVFQQHLFENISWFSALLREARVSIDTFSLGEQAWSPTQASGGMQKDAWKNFLEGAPGPAQASLMDLYKKVLAVQSGGRVVLEGEGLAGQMAECVERLAGSYALTFEPPPAMHADEYHSLAVKVKRSGLTAATNTGYYDQPYFEDAAGGDVRRITVKELQQRLQVDAKRETARALPDLMLTERLNESQRATLRARVRWGAARTQFDALADVSQFLSPSPSEIPSYPAPDKLEQQRMLAAADRFLAENTARMPNFFATRSAVTLTEGAGLRAFETTIKAQAFHVEQKFDATVSYRNGAEVVTAATPIGLAHPQPLSTSGLFGPLLRATVQAAVDLKEGVQWIRWEDGAEGRRAVFRFAVPAARAGALGVEGCCLPEATGNTPYAIVPGYHGELTVNAASGAISLVKVEADLNQFVPVRRSGLILTYGPVEIDGRAFMLPSHGISLWRGRTVITLKHGNLSFTTWGPCETRINEFTFDHYRMFRGEARLLPGFTQISADADKP